VTDERQTDADDVAVERSTPEEAFGLVAHETRLDTLRVLNDADGPLSFGDLRDRVGVRDPGQFNYHLGKLTGRFVRQDDDGYRLLPAGRRIVGSMLSGGYTHEFEGDTVSVDGRCRDCGGPLAAEFRPARLRIYCSECGFVHTEPQVPPRLFEHWDRSDAATVVDRWTKRIEFSAAVGLCHYCDGRVDRVIRLPDEQEAPDWFEGEVAAATVVTECRRCGHWWHSILPVAAVVHPAVVAFHHQHGVDVRDTPFWNLEWLAPGMATVVSESPLRVDLRVTLDGETRVFGFDRDLDLVEVRSE